MSMQAWLERHPRLTLAGDACLVSAAAFGAVIGAEFLLIGHAEPPAWIAIPASVLTLGSVLVGPALAWLLRGRRLTWWGVLGALVASVAVVLGTQALVFAAMGLAWLLTPITSAELAGPIALLALASLGFLAICSLPALGIAGALRTPARDRIGMRLLALRLAGLCLLIAFATAAGVFVATSSDPERAEVYIFAMLGGLSGAAMALGSDLAETWRRPA